MPDRPSDPEPDDGSADDDAPTHAGGDFRVPDPVQESVHALQEVLRRAM